MPQKTVFRQKLQELINTVSKENDSNTPDFILADFLNESLVAFEKAVNARESWYGRNPRPSAAECAAPISEAEPHLEGSF